MNTKPVIGVTTGYRRGGLFDSAPHSTVAEKDWHLLQGDYIRLIERLGGVPLLIPMLENEDSLRPLLAGLSGILFTGGPDIAPHYYGKQSEPGMGRIDPPRDFLEVTLARIALAETNLPLLGICRGAQLFNIVLGGTLYQDIPRWPEKFTVAHSIPGLSDPHAIAHSVTVREGSRLHTLVGETDIRVNSFHHQAVDVPGTGLAISALAPDGCVEAIELPGERFVLAVQWHLEGLWETEPSSARIARGFIDACRANQTGG